VQGEALQNPFNFLGMVRSIIPKKLSFNLKLAHGKTKSPSQLQEEQLHQIF
jgi:hypothetical protein